MCVIREQSVERVNLQESMYSLLIGNVGVRTRNLSNCLLFLGANTALVSHFARVEKNFRSHSFF